jgi:hypothetical protein
MVEGLHYTSGGISSSTNQNGQFTYTVGSTITFSVGNVTIGTAIAGPVITPLHLVPGGTVSNQQVLNIVRFLMMLDSDATLDNGIVISQQVHTLAASWPAVNFAVDDATFGTQVATIASSLGKTLPTSVTAQAHITTTIRCAIGGGYQGMWAVVVDGNSSGDPWYAVIDPVTSNLSGVIVDTVQPPSFAISAVLTPSVSGNFPSSVTGLNAISFSGTAGLDGTFSVQGNGTDPNTGAPFGFNVNGSRNNVPLPTNTNTLTYYRGTMVRNGSGGRIAWSLRLLLWGES